MGLDVAKARVALFLHKAQRIVDRPDAWHLEPIEASPLDVQAIQRVAWEMLALERDLADARAGTTTLVADVIRVVRAS